MIYDVMSAFGEPSEEVQKNGKYAKYKAAYIHNCLKNGETPIAGPISNDDEEQLEDIAGPSKPQQPAAGFYLPPTNYVPEPNQLPPANFTPTDPFKHMRAPSPPKEPERQPGGKINRYI